MYKPNEHERIEKDFKKLIDYYLNKCENPEDREVMYAELWGFLYDLVNRGRAVSQRYVAVCIRNRYIYYSKMLQNQRKHETEFDEQYAGSVNDDFVEEIAMRDLLEKLGIKQREVIVLHHVYGLSFDEIAKKKNCTRQATTALNNRGLEKLREILDGEEERIKSIYRKRGVKQ